MVECEECNGYGYYICKVCDGKGQILEDGEYITCERCDGTGKLECDECRGRREVEKIDDVCKGTGRIEIDCPKCS